MTTWPSDSPSRFDGPANYRIVVGGLVARNLSDRLQGMAIMQDWEAEVPMTTLTGELEDQAALAGVLGTLYDLQYTLLIVEQIPPGSIEGIAVSDIDKGPVT